MWVSAGTGVLPEKYPRKPGVRIGDGLSMRAEFDDGRRSSRSRLSMRVSQRARRRMTSPYASGH
eukprot:3520018-Pleurochrysis_carterae.AAC.1